MSFIKLLGHEWPRIHKPVHTININCSDRRIKGSRGLFGQLMGITMAVPITIPGGIRDIAYPRHPRDREHALEWIALLGESCDTIVAGAHNGCRACDECTDPKYYEAMLLAGRAVLRERFPLKATLLSFIDFDGLYFLEEEKEPALVGA